MKYPIFILLLTVFAFGCSEDDVKELLEIPPQDFEATETFNVDINQDDPLTYTTKKTIDAELAGFDVTKIEILSITADFTSVLSENGATSIEEATFQLITANSTISLEITDFDLSNAVGNPITFNLDANALNAISSQLLNSEEIDVNLSATLDNKPIEFDVDLIFSLRATVTL